MEVLFRVPLCAHAFGSFFTPTPPEFLDPNTTEKCVVRKGRFHRNVFGKCTSGLLMGVKKNHGSTISAVISFEPFFKEVPDGPEYKIDHHSRSREPVRAQGKHHQEVHPKAADCLCEAVGASGADSH
ncbi:conserved hypothetical protein [Nitrospira defluvii]|uniref:Uncharacterized protein n=1 Tax=Nitrospira defluvii TaxID=330214 RepID=A0ABM8QLA6_9BACT|nr:conserved hypothetical protein [Nitrospira defluvii]